MNPEEPTDPTTIASIPTSQADPSPTLIWSDRTKASGEAVEEGRVSRSLASGPTRILVVEDQKIVALELKNRLIRLGYEISAVVASAEEAVQVAARLRPHLVLMDIQLQGERDGIEAAELIRSRIDIPVVYLTAFADDDTLARAKVTEPYGYIIKPFHEGELHVAIEVALYRHQVARQLRESEAWRRALLRSAGDAVLATGPDGRIKFMNPLAEALTGWKETEVFGLELDRVFKVVELVERRSPPWREASYRKLIAKNGSEVPIETETAAIRDAQGQALGSVSIFRDISERKRLQDRQRLMAIAGSELSSSLDREEILRKLTPLIVRSLADWCVVHLVDADDALRIAVFAHARAELSTLSSQLRGKAWASQDQTCVENAARRALSSVENGGQEALWIASILGMDQEQVIALGLRAHSRVSVPLIARGRSFGSLTVVAEHCDRRLSEADVPFIEAFGHLMAMSIDNAELYDAAQRAIRMREEVLAIVSHDLRHPLANISMSASLVLRSPERLSPARAVESIQRNVDRIVRLTDDLLDVATIDAGHLRLEKKQTPVKDILSEAASLLETQAAERSIRIALSEGNLPEDLEVLCDRERILQVFSNLIGNALKFSPEGKTIRIAARQFGPTVQFQVNDEAGGIAPEQLGHIFDRYWQAPDTLRKGTGLGLYIAKAIIESHGGQIRAEAEFGVGSTFYFTLPLEQAPTPNRNPS